MTKRKKRNAITMVSLLLALAALIGVYYWYSHRSTATDNDDTQKIALATVDTTKAASLHYVRDDADLTLVLENGVWKSKDEPDRPINQDNVTSILNTVQDISADRKISDKPDNLADFGLDKPAVYLQVTQSDGAIVTLQIGNQLVTGDGYYALVNDDKKLYIVGMTYYSGLHFNNMDMTAVEKVPDIKAENVYHVSLDNRDGKDFEIKKNDNIVLDNNGSNMYPWEILQPYGAGFTADSSQAAATAQNYTGFSFIDCVDYQGKDLSKYGLDKPLASILIGYYETADTTSDASTDSTDTAKQTEQEYKLLIGNKDDSGNYYVMSGSSNAVYTMSADSVDKMLQVDPFKLLNPYASIPNIDNVDKITAEIAGKTYTMEIKHSTAKDDSSKDQTTATYYYNGKEVTEDQFKSVYQCIILAKYDAELKDEVSTDGLTPVLTLSYHIFGDNEKTITASYLPYDDSFYIVEKGNGVRFLADKRTIDKIANAIETFTGFTQ